MTPELLAAMFTGVALILAAVGLLLQKIANVLQKVYQETRAIKADTNGTATALREHNEELMARVIRLEKEIVEKTAERVVERWAAEQEASDLKSTHETERHGNAR